MGLSTTTELSGSFWEAACDPDSVCRSFVQARTWVTWVRRYRSIWVFDQIQKGLCTSVKMGEGDLEGLGISIAHRDVLFRYCSPYVLYFGHTG